MSIFDFAAHAIMEPHEPASSRAAHVAGACIGTRRLSVSRGPEYMMSNEMFVDRNNRHAHLSSARNVGQVRMRGNVGKKEISELNVGE
jgi:hypothetical protein